jgi:hypothetical protein
MPTVTKTIVFGFLLFPDATMSPPGLGKPSFFSLLLFGFVFLLKFIPVRLKLPSSIPIHSSQVKIGLLDPFQLIHSSLVSSSFFFFLVCALFEDGL